MSHLIALSLLAAAPPPAPEVLAADLGSPAFAARERATRALWRLGERSRPALQAAVRSGDPEVVWRANDLLDRFNWGLFPDTPPAVRDQIRRFRSGVAEDQHAAVADLVRAGAVPTVRILLSRPWPPDDRGRLFAHLTALLRREVPPLLVLAGDRDRAGELLALHALGGDVGGLLDLSVFEHLRGKPEASAVASPRLSVFRHRAASSLPSALEAVARTPGADRLRDALLEDAGDWATLADRPIREANSEAGLKAFRLRLAGRAADADALLNRQPDLPLGPPRDSAQELDEPTLALVLNGRAGAAVDRLTKQKYAPHVLADWLTAQLRFADALKLIEHEGTRGAGFDDRFYTALYGTRRGRLLAMLGRRDEAAEAFQATFRAVGTGRDPYPLEQLVRAEVRAGRADLGCDHLGAAVDGDRQNGRGDEGGRGLAFEALFEADADVGEALLRVLAPRGPSGLGLRRARALLMGKGDPADLRLVADAKPPDPRLEPDRALVLGQATAAVLRAAGRGEDAVAALARVADAVLLPDDEPGDLPGVRFGRGPKAWVYGTDERARFWVEFGDALTALGRHADAAARLEQGWKQFPDNPTLLFLSGRALVKAGREADGKARQDAAHWVALGNPRPRGRFLEELNARGLAGSAGKELGLAERAGWTGGQHVANVWNQAARAAVVTGDFPTAVKLYRRAVHWVLMSPRTFYMDGAAYLTVPQQAAAAEARGLLADGQVAEAVAAADACLATLPGNTELAVALVAGLDKAGHRAEADRLFRRGWDALQGVIAAHPESVWARAEAAGLAAGCRRELDAAAGYVEWAAGREPDAVPVRKALAEVRFRRGDRAGAVAVMSGLAAEDRLSHLYRRQVERYRTAPADAPPLDADDE